MKWIEISITVEVAVIDEMAAIFNDIESNGYIEETIENNPNLSRVTIYLEAHKDEKQWKQIIETALQDTNIFFEDMECKTVDDEQWYHSWQQYIMPTRLLPDLVICPVWQSYDATTDPFATEQDVVMTVDTKLSFGTGDHETTRSCATLLGKYIHRIPTDLSQQVCLDIGTGTGVLLLAAHHLGIPNLVGIDLEEEAAIQAKENCENNGIEASIIHGNLSDDFHGKAHLILANLTVDPLKILLPMIREKLHDNGILIISGIVDDRYDEIMPYITNHWTIMEEMVEGPWHTFALA